MVIMVIMAATLLCFPEDERHAGARVSCGVAVLVRWLDPFWPESGQSDFGFDFPTRIVVIFEHASKILIFSARNRSHPSFPAPSDLRPRRGS